MMSQSRAEKRGEANRGEKKKTARLRGSSHWCRSIVSQGPALFTISPKTIRRELRFRYADMQSALSDFF